MCADTAHPPSPTHDRCVELLPWYLNETVDASERLAVEAHLEQCAVCRDELVLLEELQSSVRHSSPPPIRDRFDEIVARVEGSQVGARHATPLVRWLIVGQAAAIAALVATLLWPAPGPPESSYRTLSDASSAGPAEAALRVVFSERATEVEMRALLESIDAQIVAGPNTAGAYSLRPGGEPLDDRARGELLERLRGDPLVRFAEAVAAASSPSGPRLP